jgi:hypothetical protein
VPVKLPFIPGWYEGLTLLPELFDTELVAKSGPGPRLGTSRNKFGIFIRKCYRRAEAFSFQTLIEMAESVSDSILTSLVVVIAERLQDRQLMRLYHIRALLIATEAA